MWDIKRFLLLLLLFWLSALPVFSQDISVPEDSWSELIGLFQINGEAFLSDADTLNSSSQTIQTSQESILIIKDSSKSSSETIGSLNQNQNSSEDILGNSKETTGNLETVIGDISDDNSELKKLSNKSIWIMVGIGVGSFLVGAATGAVIVVMSQ